MLSRFRGSLHVNIEITTTYVSYISWIFFCVQGGVENVTRLLSGGLYLGVNFVKRPC